MTAEARPGTLHTRRPAWRGSRRGWNLVQRAHPVTQRGVLRLERREAVAERLHGRVDLRLRESRRDVLRTVPVEGLEVQAQDPLRLRLVARVGDEAREGRVRIERHDLDPGVDLHA